MNWLTKILLALFVLHFNGQAQSTVEARKLDVVPKPNCEMEKMFLAMFHNELEKDPTAVGVILIKGDRSSMRWNAIFESSVKNFLKTIGTDPNRYEVLRSKSDSETTWELWIVPSGALPPKIERSAWSYKAQPGSLPYLFASENVFGDDICPEVDEVRIFTEFLNANPTAKANIVIRGTASRSINRTKQRVLSTLTRTYKVPKTKLRFFVAKEIPNGMNPRVEYWFVP